MTGVQTCALPIFAAQAVAGGHFAKPDGRGAPRAPTGRGTAAIPFRSGRLRRPLWHGARSSINTTAPPFWQPQHIPQSGAQSYCFCKCFFDYCGAIFALPGRSSLVTAVRFLNGQEALSTDYSGAKYAHFILKIAAALKALFLVVENGGFFNRLRNVHLEKSAVTGA